MATYYSYIRTEKYMNPSKDNFDIDIYLSTSQVYILVVRKNGSPTGVVYEVEQSIASEPATSGVGNMLDELIAIAKSDIDTNGCGLF